MATVLMVLAEDVETGDKIRVEEDMIVIVETDIINFPDEFMAVDYGAVDIDPFNVKIGIDGGYLIVPRDTKFPFTEEY
jgi:hypothetical protein